MLTRGVDRGVARARFWRRFASRLDNLLTPMLHGSRFFSLFLMNACPSSVPEPPDTGISVSCLLVNVRHLVTGPGSPLSRGY